MSDDGELTLMLVARFVGSMRRMMGDSNEAVAALAAALFDAAVRLCAERGMPRDKVLERVREHFDAMGKN